jgi:tetratricopeptide (TPR) repeat protein
VFDVFDKRSKGFNNYLVGAAYENIGLVFYEQGKYEKSLRYYFSAYDTYYRIFEDDSDNLNFARLFCNIANSYIHLDQYSKAEECLNRAREIAHNIALSASHSLFGRIEQASGAISIAVNQ